jgi:hypothetical protein
MATRVREELVVAKVVRAGSLEMKRMGGGCKRELEARPALSPKTEIGVPNHFGTPIAATVFWQSIF